MKNTSFAFKLIMAFSIATLVAIVIGLVGYRTSDLQKTQISNIYNSNFIPVTTLARTVEVLYAHRTASLQHVIAPDDESMTELEGVMDFPQHHRHFSMSC